MFQLWLLSKKLLRNKSYIIVKIFQHTCLINFVNSSGLHVNFPPTSATIGQDGKPRSLAIWSNISTFGEYICNESPNLSTAISAGVNNLAASVITTLYRS